MEKDEWLTPREIIAELGPFDLDPCAPIVRPWDTAAKHFTIEDDGLSRDWTAYERVWLNPPYGSFTGHWLEKLVWHGNGIALIFARTETEDWFTHIWPKADAVFFLEGRLYFHHVSGARAKSNSGAPSALIAYGFKNFEKLRTTRIRGKFIPLK